MDTSKKPKHGFLAGTTRGLRFAAMGFAICILGVSLGFLGFYVGSRSMASIAFVIASLGVLLGFIGVLYGWIWDTKKSVKNYSDELKKIESKQPWE